MSPILIVVLVIAAVFGGIMVIGIIAAIAIPGLLRARVAGNEASAIGALRAMSSAQAVWTSTHNGRPALPSCLGDPASCGDTTSPPFLSADVAFRKTRSGYDFGFVLRPGQDDRPPASSGSSATGEAAAADPTDAEVRAELEKFSTPDTGATPTTPAAPTGMVPTVGQRRPAHPLDPGGFAFWASPSNFGVSGNRHFCVDETGVVREYVAGVSWTPPSDADPRCPDTGRPLQ